MGALRARRPRGNVSIVGAGPGDPELITVRGLRRLRRADVIVYDRLVHPDLLEEALPGAERIYVGKARGAAALDQCDIEALLVTHARAGKQVVRLKGGDPFVFGRGGEEVEALAAAGIAHEVIPGITSAVAVPGGAGIPVTHRRLASMVTVVTGHEDPSRGEPAVDWEWLAAGSGTLVILMGLEQLEGICTRLIAGRRDAATPAAVIASGTLPEQRTVTATLASLHGVVERAGLRSPAIIVVGEVAAFPDHVASLGLTALAEAV
jgi:uroporphyrin-III C-methyltransferase